MHQESMRADSIRESIERYSDMVYRLAFSMMKNKYDADDIHQEVFVQYISHYPKLESEEHKKAWLIRVTVNTCKNWWKSAWQRKVCGMLEEHGRVNKILERAKDNSAYRKKQLKWQLAIITLLLAVTLCVDVNIPTFAQEIERMIQIWETGVIDYASYKSLQRNGTKMHSYIPEYTMIRKDGIIMNVELVMFRDKDFVAYLSFADEEGSNLIHKDGTYNWNSISVRIGEKVLKHHTMEFLKYDEEKDKVYYVYTASTGTSKLPEGEIVHIEVNGFFESIDRKESVDLSNIPLEADTRVVKILNSSVDETLLTLESTEYPYMASVLNTTPLSEVKTDSVSITGVAYIDGVLRVQISKPDNGVAESFSETAYIDHYNSSGQQILPEQRPYIYWYEKTDGQLMEFIETYYVVPEENVREIPLVVNIHEKRGCIHTTWEVDFEVEK